jgi:hypothetical protein
MRVAHRYWVGMLVWSLSLVGCDGKDPLDPSINPSFRATEAPAGIAATAVSYNRVDLSWTDRSSNETGFELHRSSDDSGGAIVLHAQLGAGVVAFVDGGLSASSQYCYKVRAYRTTGRKTTYSEFSSTVCATTPARPVANAPSGTDARPLSSTSVEVRWTDNSVDETGFTVEYSLDDGATWSLAGNRSANVTSLPHFPATEQVVCYRVIAHNIVGPSAPSSTDCTAAPRGPENVTAAGVSSSEIGLTWTDRSAVEDGYEVQRISPSNMVTAVATLPANATSYRDAGVTADTRYTYRVAALRDGGRSDFGFASGLASGVAPNAPTAARAGSGGSTHAWVEWTDQSSNEEGFRVERSLDGGATWTTVGTASWNSWVLGDGQATTEAVNCYRVIAINGAGDSPPSNTACVTPLASPTGLTATAAPIAGAIDLTWTDRSGAEEGFDIYRFVTQCDYYYGCYSYYAPIARVGANVTTYRDEGLASFSTEWYYVVAISASGTSDPSIEASATVPGGGE